LRLIFNGMTLWKNGKIESYQTVHLAVMLMCSTLKKMCDALLLMCNWSTLARKNGQLLLMHRPTIAHAPTNYCSRTDQLLLMHWQSNYWSVTQQLLVGYPSNIDHIMSNNTASRNTYYWSYIWPSTGRIIFWVYVK
jgi:hypothetical protein